MADEHAVAAALQRLAKRRAARQYSAFNTSGHQGQNWHELFKKMDFNREKEAAVAHNEDDFISAGDEFADPWSRAVGKAPRSAHKPRDRHASANATFETFVNHDQRPVSGHLGWFDSTADQGRSRAAGARSSEEKSIHVDLKKEYSGAQEMPREEKTAVGETAKSSSVSREEYNRQMKLISQKLSEEKVRLQKQLQQYPCLPRPPPARPSPGARKVVSHNRMIR